MTHIQESNMPTSRSPFIPTSSARQSGLSLIVVLLALVTLAFASVALIRSIDTGSLVMGNLSFKKAATTSSDQIANTAIAWLEPKLEGATLFVDDATNAYSAASLNNLDVAGNSNSPTRARIDWAGDGTCGGCLASKTCSACVSPSAAIDTADGFKHRYLITRMCLCAGDPNGTCGGTTTSNSCSTPISTSSSTSMKKEGIDYSDPGDISGLGSPYFRIIVRTEGPRNTATVTETYVHF